MNKITRKKLALDRTTIRTLSSDALAHAAGGMSKGNCNTVDYCVRTDVCTGGICGFSDNPCPSGPAATCP